MLLYEMVVPTCSNKRLYFCDVVVHPSVWDSCMFDGLNLE